MKLLDSLAYEGCYVAGYSTARVGSRDFSAVYVGYYKYYTIQVLLLTSPIYLFIHLRNDFIFLGGLYMSVLQSFCNDLASLYCTREPTCLYIVLYGSMW